MPSSSEPRTAVRAARFDRPLAGAEAARLGAGWGDPALDALLADAVEEGRRQGLAQGYATGWAAGRRAAAEREAVETAARAEQAEADRREQARRADQVLASLAAAAATLAGTHAPGYEELADVLTDGALAIARAAVARELLSVDDDLERRVRAAVRELAGDGHLVLHLHPDDAALLAGAAVPAGAELVPDPAVTRGTVSVRGEVRRLHHDVAAAVAAAQEVLRP